MSLTAHVDSLKTYLLVIEAAVCVCVCVCVCVWNMYEYN
jgi:hypothetical protein